MRWPRRKTVQEDMDKQVQSRVKRKVREVEEKISERGNREKVGQISGIKRKQVC